MAVYTHIIRDVHILHMGHLLPYKKMLTVD